jgi:hypothetical protein
MNLRLLLSVPSRILLLASAALFIASSHAEERGSYTSIGKLSCKDWRDDRRKDEKDNKKFWSIHGTFWILGFMTAINALEDKKDLLADVNVDTLVAWTDKYCRENPNKDVLDSSIELTLKLRKTVK